MRIIGVNYFFGGVMMLARKSPYKEGTQNVKVTLPKYLVEYFKAKPGFKFSPFFTEKLEKEFLKENSDIDVAKRKRNV